MTCLERSKWAETLARELERPHVRIDYGYIVIWLDHGRWYNHATIFGDTRPKIVISRFRDLQLDAAQEDDPTVYISCMPFEALELTRWVVQWSRSNEAGTPPLMDGLHSVSHLPRILAQTEMCRIAK